MAIKATDTPILKVIKSDRFEPRFHAVYNKFDDYEKSLKYQILRFGDKRILKRITDGEHAGQIFVEKGIRFIKNSAVKDFSIDLLDGFFITEEKHNQLKRSSLKPLDILFTTVGHLGSTAIVPKNLGEANINQNVVKIEIEKKFINPFYLTAYLNSNTTKKQISALFTGNIHSIITYPKIKNIRVVVPDKEFQEDIANKYQKAIELDEKFYALIKKAQILFRQRLDIDFAGVEKQDHYSVSISSFAETGLWTPAYSRPLYVNTLKAIQRKWPTVPLGEIATTQKGDEVGSDNYNRYLEKKDSDVPFIRTSDLVNHEVDQYPDFYIPEEIHKELKQDIGNGDVLFSNDGKIGLTAMLTAQDEVILQSHIKRIRLKKEAIRKYRVSQEYLFLVLATKEVARYQAARYTVVQSTIPTVSDRVLSFAIPILDINSINEITRLVRRAFELKAAKKKIITEIRKRIDNYFEI